MHCEIIYTTRFDSPVGNFRVASTDRGLAYVQLPNAAGRGFSGWQIRCMPEAECREGYEQNRRAVKQILEYLKGKRTEFDLELDLQGTPFQLDTWYALCEIPYGEVRTYSEIARAIGRPKAVRAVGTANGSNPLSLIVPCHRVVAAGGKLGGYGGGLPLKKKLLVMESETQPCRGRLL
jgi:O-6-methylguanine DNA methyltransferase